jgi:hypothetical protein
MGLAAVVEAGFEHGDALDDRGHGLVLADDALGEVAAHRGEIDALPVVQHRRREARELRERVDDVRRHNARGVALGAAPDRQLQ